MLCKSMKWAHLPVPGGLYAQHPKLLDDFMIIMAIESEAEKRKNAKLMNEAAAKKNKGSSRPAGGRRRR